MTCPIRVVQRLNRGFFGRDRSKGIECSAPPLKTGPSAVKGSHRMYHWLGEEFRHEGIEGHGRAENVRHQSSHDGSPVAEICRKAGVGEATYFN